MGTLPASTHQPAALHLVPEPTGEHDGRMVVDRTPDGAVVTLSPVVAVEVATALIQAGTPEQFARMTAASCHHAAGGTGVALLAALLLEHTRVHLDRVELREHIDQLDDALVATPADAALEDDHADETADSWRDR